MSLPPDDRQRLSLLASDLTGCAIAALVGAVATFLFPEHISGLGGYPTAALFAAWAAWRLEKMRNESNAECGMRSAELKTPLPRLRTPRPAPASRRDGWPQRLRPRDPDPEGPSTEN